MRNSEMLARAMCRESGVDEEALVSCGPPMYGPQTMNFYYVPTHQQPAWELFMPLAQTALSNFGKLKIAED